MTELVGKKPNVREVKLPSNIDPAIGVGMVALIASQYEANRVLREALGLPVGPTVRFVLGDKPAERGK